MDTLENLDELEKLADLKEKGILTPQEFEEQKKRLITALQKASIRTKRNWPETIFMWAMYGYMLAFILLALWADTELFRHFRSVSCIALGFLIFPVLILWIIALCLRPFVIRARYFFYFLLLPMAVAAIGSIVDYFRIYMIVLQ